MLGLPTLQWDTETIKVLPRQLKNFLLFKISIHLQAVSSDQGFPNVYATCSVRIHRPQHRNNIVEISVAVE